MGEPAEVSGLPSTRTNCLYCGAELGPEPSEVKGLCASCATRMLPKSEAKPTPKNQPARPVQRQSVHLQPLSLPPKGRRLNDALAELVAKGPASESPKMVGELLAADKRVAALMALIPFVGPWLVQRSDAHTDREKRVLTWISIAFTAAIVGALVLMMPTDEQRLTQLQQRMQDQMNVLAGVAEQYRAEHGSYPNSSVWRRYTERADPRFYDPWARPYLYDAGANGITLKSFGRDGVPGGVDDDADISASFPMASPH